MSQLHRPALAAVACATFFVPVLGPPLFSARPIYPIFGHPLPTVHTQDFTLEGNRLISCGMDHSLKVWSLDTHQVVDVCQDYILDRGYHDSSPR